MSCAIISIKHKSNKQNCRHVSRQSDILILSAKKTEIVFKKPSRKI